MAFSAAVTAAARASLFSVESLPSAIFFETASTAALASAMAFSASLTAFFTPSLSYALASALTLRASAAFFRSVCLALAAASAAASTAASILALMASAAFFTSAETSVASLYLVSTSVFSAVISFWSDSASSALIEAFILSYFACSSVRMASASAFALASFALTVIEMSSSDFSAKPTVARMPVSLTTASPVNVAGAVRFREKRTPSSPGMEFMKSAYITRLLLPALVRRPLTTSAVQPSGSTTSAWKPLMSSPAFCMSMSTLPVFPAPMTVSACVKATTGLPVSAPPLALTVSVMLASTSSLMPSPAVAWMFSRLILAVPVVKLAGATRLRVNSMPSSPGMGFSLSPA